MEPVRSPRNARVARAARLRRASERSKTGLTLLEGPHILQEAIAAGVEPLEVFGLEGDPSRDLAERIFTPVTQEVLNRLAPTESPRGPVAVISIPSPGEVCRDSLTVGVGDPGNAGTLIRTAAAFGLDVIVGEGAVDVWSPKVLRAGAGCHFRTTIGRRPATVRTIAAVVTGGLDPSAFGSELDRDVIWTVLVGNEAQGLSAAEIASADVKVTIPMRGGTESLNAAVAGSIVAYELARWRNSVGPDGGLG